MARSGPEVADVFRRYGEAYRERHGASLCTAQRRVMSAIELCRTATLGGHIEHCDRCDHQRICYNSCRDRHCPKCQSLARAQWLDNRRSELLDTQYFHVIFTVPQPIATIALQNKDVVYNILFRATSETLRTIAADPKHLGAQIGFFAVLHTWGQALLHHPHLHCVVPGGDPLLLKQKLIETTSIIAKVSAEKVALADERNVAIVQRDAALQENEKLLLILSQYKRALFGRRSEKMDADQLQLLLSEMKLRSSRARRMRTRLPTAPKR